MAGAPLVLGAMLGAGVLLAVMGLRTLTDRRLADDRRRRGYWPLNGGLILTAVSVWLFTASAS